MRKARSGSFGANLTALLLLLLPGWASAQTVRAGDLELDLTGRVQFQVNSTSVDGADVSPAPPDVVFETRRVRLGAGFSFGDWVTGKVEADFAGAAARLTDGYADVALAEALVVRLGQFRQPFGVFELESSTKIRTIERAVRIRGLEELVGQPGEAQWLLDAGGYLGRQIGAMAHGSLGGFTYAAGVFNGEGANQREEAGSKAYVGRVTLAPSESLRLGAGASAQPVDVAGEETRRGVVWGVDATWGGFREQGLHVKAEAFTGENVWAAGGADLPTMRGAHAVVSWFAPQDGRVEGVEPVVRVSWGDPNTEVEADEGLLVTPGVNLYLDGRNRLMLNGDVYVPAADELDPELAIVAQMQVYF